MSQFCHGWMTSLMRRIATAVRHANQLPDLETSTEFSNFDYPLYQLYPKQARSVNFPLFIQNKKAFIA